MQWSCEFVLLKPQLLQIVNLCFAQALGAINSIILKLSLLRDSNNNGKHLFAAKIRYTGPKHFVKVPKHFLIPFFVT